MEKEFLKAIEIVTDTEEAKMALGAMIHEQLVGHPDYVENNIVLNIDDPCAVRLIIFKECKDIPKIEI